MRVMLVSPESDFTAQVRDAFKEEGHDVRYINERGLARWPMLWWLIRHVRPVRRLRNRLFGRHLIRTALRFKPDLVLINKGMAVKKSTLQALRGAGARLANWFPENGLREPYRSWLEEYIGQYDLFFCFDSSLLERQAEFPNTRIVYLPFGVDPDAYAVSELTAEDHARYDADICFVGAWYPEREQALFELAQWNVKIFGWKGWSKSSLAARYHGPLDAHQSAKAYRCATIVLNMNLQPPVNGVNAKTFEICAAGGFQVTDFRADLPRLFREDDELVVYRDIADLKAKVARYLSDAADRTRIARAGQERVVREHTMRHRVRSIISSLT